MKDTPYASAVRSLMYAQICARPYISFAVGMLERYKCNPGLDHWRGAKKVLIYLQGTKDYMLMYKQPYDLEVIGYSYLDIDGCVDSRKIYFRIHICVSRWSYLLEKCQTDSSYYFHYGG